LSPYVLEGEHHEASFVSLTRHELRWMRTIRILRPRSFCLLFLSFSLPLSLFGIALTAGEPYLATAAWILFGSTVAARLVLHFVHRFHADRRLLADWWLVGIRDVLTCVNWCRSFLSSRVTWRETEFSVDADGVMHRIS
jgi:ceramide glucosyltransferase